jgi:hypothetical protein
MQRVGRVFAQMAFSSALGLAAGTFIPLPILVSSFVGLVGGRAILQRQHSPFADHLLNLGSSSSRLAREKPA